MKRVESKKEVKLFRLPHSKTYIKNDTANTAKNNPCLTDLYSYVIKVK